MEQAEIKAASRGFVWVLVGLAIFAYGWISKHPILVRGTHIPFGWVVIALGIGITVWDVAKIRRTKASR